MKYKNATQRAREKFLQRKQLSRRKEDIIEKDFGGKDYAYYESIKDTEMFLLEQYSADATYNPYNRVFRACLL